MSLMSRRFAAVEETIAKVRAAEAELGVTPAALAAIKQHLIDLATRTELFPPEEFVIPAEEPSRLYRLAEDADHRFALYAMANRPGRTTPPHNHTTWAVIAGVRGREHNVLYERTDQGEIPGQGRLRQTGELIVVAGNAVGFLPNDFHRIEALGPEPGLHLHLYGLSLDHLPNRVTFEQPTGGAYEVYPTSPYIATLAIPPATLRQATLDPEDLVILDVREPELYARGHLPGAISAPRERIDQVIDRLAPGQATRVVVVDGDGGALSQDAARYLFDRGWKNIVTLRGGLAAWLAAGEALA